MRDLALWVGYATGWSAVVALLSSGVAALLSGRGWQSRWVWATALVLCVVGSYTVAFRSPTPAMPPAIEALEAARQIVARGPGELPASRTHLTMGSRGAAGWDTLRVTPDPTWSLAASLPPPSSSVERILLGLTFCSLVIVAYLVTGRAWLAWKGRRWRTTTLDGERVAITPDLGPAVLGIVRPTIVAPEWFAGAPEVARAFILQHEREHIAHRDPWLRLFALVSCLLAPWNLVGWWLAARLVHAIETDCDIRVVRTLGHPHAYCRALLLACALGSATRHPAVVALGLTARPLEHRVRRLLDLADRHRPFWRRTGVALGLASGLLGLAGATWSAASFPPPPSLKPLLAREVFRAPRGPLDTPPMPVDTAALVQFIRTRLAQVLTDPIHRPIVLQIDDMGIPHMAHGMYLTPHKWPDAALLDAPPCLPDGPLERLEMVRFPAGTLRPDRELVVCQLYRLHPVPRPEPLRERTPGSRARFGDSLPAWTRRYWDTEHENYLRFLTRTVKKHQDTTQVAPNEVRLYMWLDTDREGAILGAGYADSYNELMTHPTDGAELRGAYRLFFGPPYLVLAAQYPDRAAYEAAQR